MVATDESLPWAVEGNRRWWVVYGSWCCGYVTVNDPDARPLSWLLSLWSLLIAIYIVMIVIVSMVLVLSPFHFFLFSFLFHDRLLFEWWRKLLSVLVCFFPIFPYFFLFFLLYLYARLLCEWWRTLVLLCPLLWWRQRRYKDHMICEITILALIRRLLFNRIYGTMFAMRTIPFRLSLW